MAEGEVSIDQAALTGESLPVSKAIGDEIFSGSTCKQGEAEAIGRSRSMRAVVRESVRFSDWNGSEYVLWTCREISR